jgi:hypothetical protein
VIVLLRDITSPALKHHIRSRSMDAPKKSDEVVAFEIEAFTLLAIALLVTSLRTYSRFRIVGIRRFEADDYLVLVGAVSVLDRPLTHFVWTICQCLALFRSSIPSKQAVHMAAPSLLVGSRITR